MREKSAVHTLCALLMCWLQSGRKLVFGYWSVWRGFMPKFSFQKLSIRYKCIVYHFYPPMCDVHTHRRTVFATPHKRRKKKKLPRKPKAIFNFCAMIYTFIPSRQMHISGLVESLRKQDTLIYWTIVRCQEQKQRRSAIWRTKKQEWAIKKCKKVKQPIKIWLHDPHIYFR